MDFLISLIAKHLLTKTDPSKITKEGAKAAVQDRMSNAVEKIAAAMEKGGFTNPQANTKAVIRDALFRLWRTVIPSGDVANIVRDSQDDRVVAIVQPRVVAGVTLVQVVTMTMDAALDVSF